MNTWYTTRVPTTPHAEHLKSNDIYEKCPECEKFIRTAKQLGHFTEVG